MFLSGSFYLMFLVYKVWNQLYQACRSNIDQDSALNQKGYYSYIKFKQLVLFNNIQNCTDMKICIFDIIIYD